MSDTVSAALFQNLILMVAPYYKVDSEKTFSNFQKGVSLFTRYIFLQDTLVDGDADWVEQYTNGENILTEISFSHQHALQSLQSVFDAEHPFWDYLAQEEQAYYHYIVKEKYQNIKKPEITVSDFEEMAFAKHALALVPIKGMDWLFQSSISYEKVKTIFAHIFYGIQMIDDIDDFSKDLHSGQWNRTQFLVQKVINDEELINDGSIDKFEERVFYAAEICLEQFQYALQNYQTAEKLAFEAGLTELTLWLNQLITEVKESIAFVEEKMM